MDAGWPRFHLTVKRIYSRDGAGSIPKNWGRISRRFSRKTQVEIYLNLGLMGFSGRCKGWHLGKREHFTPRFPHITHRKCKSENPPRILADHADHNRTQPQRAQRNTEERCQPQTSLKAQIKKQGQVRTPHPAQEMQKQEPAADFADHADQSNTQPQRAQRSTEERYSRRFR